MSEPKSKASPIPWKAKEGTFTVICDADSQPVAYVVHPDPEEKRQLIVQAVNSHEMAREMADTALNLNNQIGRYNINHDTFDIPDREWEKLMTILDKFREMNK